MSHDHEITHLILRSAANGNYTVHHPQYNQQLRSISLQVFGQNHGEPNQWQQKTPNAIIMAPVVGNPGTTPNQRPPLSTRCSLPTTRRAMIQDYERYYGAIWSLCGRLRSRKWQILLSIGHAFLFLAARGLSSLILNLDRIFSAVHGLDIVRNIGLLGCRRNTNWFLWWILRK